MKAHLLVFDPIQVDKDAFRDAVDRISTVENWTLFFGNTMCLASRKSASELADEIRGAMPRARFLITTIGSEDKAGWLPKELWRVIDKPTAFIEKSDA